MLPANSQPRISRTRQYHLFRAGNSSFRGRDLDRPSAKIGIVRDSPGGDHLFLHLLGHRRSRDRGHHGHKHGHDEEEAVKTCSIFHVRSHVYHGLDRKRLTTTKLTVSLLLRRCPLPHLTEFSVFLSSSFPAGLPAGISRSVQKYS